MAGRAHGDRRTVRVPAGEERKKERHVFDYLHMVSSSEDRRMKVSGVWQCAAAWMELVNSDEDDRLTRTAL